MEPLRGAVDQGTHPLDVGIPAALRAPVGVAHDMPNDGFLPQISHTAAIG